jgi:hypothetical protein
MALTTVSTGNTINASDLNQIINVLQRLTTQSETGAYYLGYSSWQTGALGSLWIPSLSRNATPSSSSVDSSLQAASNIVTSPPSLAVAVTTSSGLQIVVASTTNTNNAHIAGVWVLNF